MPKNIVKYAFGSLKICIIFIREKYEIYIQKKLTRI